MFVALRRWKGLALATMPVMLLAAAPIDDADRKRDAEIESMWARGKSFLEPAGITPPMFKALSYWVELQYHLGYCTDHLKADDVHYWTTWWDGSALQSSEVGRQLLSKGRESYQDGRADGAKKHPTAELCQRVADDWFADMKRVMAEAGK